MEPAQIVLIIVSITLTCLLTLIGIQVYLILKELRESVRKTNKILDHADEAALAIIRPMNSLSESLENLSNIGSIVGYILGKNKIHKRD